MKKLNEEHVNTITHAIGLGLAIAGLVLLTVNAALSGTVWHVVGFSVFGATLVILYAASTLYHAMNRPTTKRLFRIFDHMSIYLLIAGTYTPFCFTVLKGWIGWTVFGIIWGCALSGIILKTIYTGRGELISTLLYLLMGWSVILFIKPVFDGMTAIGFTYLILGGAAYSAGVFFFLRENIRYAHSIWHLFVVAGSVLHFFSVLTLLTPGVNG